MSQDKVITNKRDFWVGRSGVLVLSVNVSSFVSSWLLQFWQIGLEHWFIRGTLMSIFMGVMFFGLLRCWRLLLVRLSDRWASGINYLCWLCIAAVFVVLYLMSVI